MSMMSDAGKAARETGASDQTAAAGIMLVLALDGRITAEAKSIADAMMGGSMDDGEGVALLYAEVNKWAALNGYIGDDGELTKDAEHRALSADAEFQMGKIEAE